jgi:hypothetical protein
VTGPEELPGLLTAYRTATAPQVGLWSPIEQERRDWQAGVLAREIADVLAAVADTRPLLARV